MENEWTRKIRELESDIKDWKHIGELQAGRL